MTNTADLNARVAIAKGWKEHPPATWEQPAIPVMPNPPAYSTDPALWGPLLVEVMEARANVSLNKYAPGNASIHITRSDSKKQREHMRADTPGEAVVRVWLEVFENANKE